jgi:hypothetical protein
VVAVTRRVGESTVGEAVTVDEESTTVEKSEALWANGLGKGGLSRPWAGLIHFFSF